METKIVYQYTYFIYPYLLKNIKYQEYVSKLLNNKKYKLKVFQKEKDIEIYEFFKKNIINNYFNSVKNDIYNQEKILKNKCTIFEYIFSENTDKKNNVKNNNLIYEIPKIELICFETGICFLAIKTQLLNEKINMNDILNFNYKMRDINSGFNKLKSYENINIENNLIKDDYEINKKIQKIIMCNLEHKRFFTYSYVCTDLENWNSDIDKTENDFIKYVNVYPSNYDMSLEEGVLNRINNWKYVKIGFTKESMNLLTNNLENSNFTKLPYEYENKYFYNLILNLYKKELIENIENNNIKFKIIKKQEEPNIEILTSDFTEDNVGVKINTKLEQIFNLKEKINKIEKIRKRKIEFKVIKNYKNMEKIIFIILIISLIFNITNLLY